MATPTDSRWPTAAAWLALPPQRDGQWVRPDFIVAGVPAHERSISPTNAHTTPTAVREALRKYSSWAGHRDVDLQDLVAADIGDISNPDAPDGFDRTVAILRSAQGYGAFTALLGGDNSVTYPGVVGLLGPNLSEAGLITFDAHHDVRDGWSNGSPVRQLVEAGLPGTQIVQIGIAGFANSKAYSERVREFGIHVISREDCHRRTAQDVIAEAFDVIGQRPTYLDVDVDVCDRSVAPGCPASSPGGLAAHTLRDLVFYAARAPQVQAMDLVEVDASTDAPDARTVRLTALCLLEAAAGVAARSAASASATAAATGAASASSTAAAAAAPSTTAGNSDSSADPTSPERNSS